MATLATATAMTNAKRESIVAALLAFGASGVSEGVLDGRVEVELLVLCVTELYLEEIDSILEVREDTSEGGVTLGVTSVVVTVVLTLGVGLLGTGYAGDAGVVLGIGGGWLSNGGYDMLDEEGCAGW